MSVTDPDPFWIAFRLVIVALSLAMVVFGARVAASRRFPAAWIRVARLPASQRSQPVRIGGGQALIGASLLIQQAPFLVPMPFPVGFALLVVALLLAGASLGWYLLRRD
ncbi:hypothetical protein GA0074692_4900 [Micromonospora pallida]|uniref:SdpI/YhfL protein family protein n=1 Tax=Micromonospora pallida TaxID=145854 RepID=A0A1C6T8V7_9ACTN|nr:hypothetical protein [Micromonospora pallida]SCL38107.1 hypothetical protein GA0074692_4900 [Micromonospora pallida]